MGTIFWTIILPLAKPARGGDGALLLHDGVERVHPRRHLHEPGGHVHGARGPAASSWAASRSSGATSPPAPSSSPSRWSSSSCSCRSTSCPASPPVASRASRSPSAQFPQPGAIAMKTSRFAVLSLAAALLSRPRARRRQGVLQGPDRRRQRPGQLQLPDRHRVQARLVRPDGLHLREEGHQGRRHPGLQHHARGPLEDGLAASPCRWPSSSSTRTARRAAAPPTLPGPQREVRPRQRLGEGHHHLAAELRAREGRGGQQGRPPSRATSSSPPAPRARAAR